MTDTSHSQQACPPELEVTNGTEVPSVSALEKAWREGYDAGYSNAQTDAGYGHVWPSDLLNDKNESWQDSETKTATNSFEIAFTEIGHLAASALAYDVGYNAALEQIQSIAAKAQCGASQVGLRLTGAAVDG